MDSTTCGQSPVWAYFDKLSNGKASCKTCRYIFQVRQIILLVESESFHPGGGGAKYLGQHEDEGLEVELPNPDLKADLQWPEGNGFGRSLRPGARDERI